MLEEKTKTIKERLQDCGLESFSASYGWLDEWKTPYNIKERQIADEAGVVLEETMNSWMERRQELTTRYSSENIWNMDESGCFLKTLPDKGLVEKGK